MQDIAKQVKGPMGVLEMERLLTYTTCKNSLELGALAQATGKPSSTILECESDHHLRSRKLLEYLGCEFEESVDQQVVLNGIRISAGPRVIIHPRLCSTVGGLRKRLKPGKMVKTEHDELDYAEEVSIVSVVRPEDFANVKSSGGLIYISDEGNTLIAFNQKSSENRNVQEFFWQDFN